MRVVWYTYKGFMRSNLRNFTVSYLAVTILFCGFFFAFKASSYAAATTPPIIGYQGRLEIQAGIS